MKFFRSRSLFKLGRDTSRDHCKRQIQTTHARRLTSDEIFDRRDATKKIGKVETDLIEERDNVHLLQSL